MHISLYISLILTPPITHTRVHTLSNRMDYDQLLADFTQERTGLRDQLQTLTDAATSAKDLHASIDAYEGA